MSLAISFAALVKNNNGMFKSEKQASFLLSMCNDTTYGTSGTFGRSSFYIYYICDEKGVVKVEKRTDKKGTILTWERREEGKLTVQDKKEIASLKRMLKQNLSSFESMSNYKWADPEMGITTITQYKENITLLTNQLLELGVTV